MKSKLHFHSFIEWCLWAFSATQLASEALYTHEGRIHKSFSSVFSMTLKPESCGQHCQVLLLVWDGNWPLPWVTFTQTLICCCSFGTDNSLVLFKSCKISWVRVCPEGFIPSIPFLLCPQLKPQLQHYISLYSFSLQTVHSVFLFALLTFFSL